MKITVVLAVLVLALIVGACGGETKAEQSSSQTQKIGESPDIPLLSAINYDLVEVVEQHMATGQTPMMLLFLLNFLSRVRQPCTWRR